MPPSSLYYTRLDSPPSSLLFNSTSFLAHEFQVGIHQLCAADNTCCDALFTRYVDDAAFGLIVEGYIHWLHAASLWQHLEL